MEKTIQEFQEIYLICSNIFSKKLKDYGAAWRILRTESLTDQIYIKARRIRGIEVNNASKIDEGVVDEFIGIVNYSIVALIQLELGFSENIDISAEQAEIAYKVYFDKALDLMTRKNHDYGEAWRNMRVSSFTDLILMKLHRTKQIEDNAGATLISEGVDANYYDMLNYAVFALIKLQLTQE
ncbi:MAG: hypothetical protein RIS47_788 [Bacteroidota bacterium]|jgi:hypothetical protein